MVTRSVLFAFDRRNPAPSPVYGGAPAVDDWLATVRPTDPFACLSVRECEIAGQVARGRSNKEIARALDISPNTVSSHLRQIFAKLGLVRRAELCRLWYRAEQLEREHG